MADESEFHNKAWATPDIETGCNTARSTPKSTIEYGRFTIYF